MGTKNKTQLVEMPIEKLIEANWNYKYRGTEEQISKLAASINKDGSVGVLAVRELQTEQGTIFEVIDGNHRLQAVQFLGWKKVPVENFGNIDLADAVTIARRRNHQWFEDDKLQLAKLMSEEVIPHFKEEDLLAFMPDTAEDLEAFKNLANFDWTEPEKNEESSGGDSGEYVPKKTIILKIDEEVFNIWSKWLERTKKVTGLGTPERAFEFAIIEALNVPEEDLQAKEI